MKREDWDRKYAEKEQLWSLEPNRHVVEEVQALGRARAAREDVAVDFRYSDLLDFEPERGAFDLVLILFLQLPPDERQLVLSRAEAALAPGGTLVMIGHELANLTEGVGGPSDPRVLYTPENIVAELPTLEVEKAERVLREVTDADRPAIDALVRARRRSG